MNAMTMLTHATHESTPDVYVFNGTTYVLLPNNRWIGYTANGAEELIVAEGEGQRIVSRKVLVFDERN